MVLVIKKVTVEDYLVIGTQTHIAIQFQFLILTLILILM